MIKKIKKYPLDKSLTGRRRRCHIEKYDKCAERQQNFKYCQNPQIPKNRDRLLLPSISIAMCGNVVKLQKHHQAPQNRDKNDEPINEATIYLI